jgi:hypothetical protein
VHAAVAAWRQLDAGNSISPVIEVLKPPKRKSAVYRLVSVGPTGANVIAKRCRRRTALIENEIYGSVLNSLDVSPLHVYGVVDDPDAEFAWLFLEDAGDLSFSMTDLEHRKAAGRWLAALHSCQVDERVRAMLPRRGADDYLEILRLAHSIIVESLANPAFSADQAAVLEDIALQCRRLESRSQLIVEICDAIDSTLVHGDLGEKNVRMVGSAGATTFVPFDWETSGWGCPAIDLSVVDLSSYSEAARKRGRDIDGVRLKQAACVGRAFWCLAPIRGEASSLSANWVDSVMGKMRFYQLQIAEAMTEIGWNN